MSALGGQSQIPNELFVYHIWPELPYQFLKSTAPQVCKRWQQAVYSTRTLTLERNSSTDLNQYHNLKNLALVRTSVCIPTDLQLDKLALARGTAHRDSNQPDTKIQVRTLSIAYRVPSLFHIDLSSIVRLGLSDCSFPETGTFDFSLLPQLQCAHLNKWKEVNLSGASSTLHSLVLTYTGGPCDLSSVPSLRRLKTIYTRQLTGWRQLPNLTDLFWINPNSLTDVADLTSLVRLRVEAPRDYMYTQPPSGLIVQLGHLPKLQQLRVSDLECSFTLSEPNLRTLKIKQTEGEMIIDAPQLKQLAMARTNNRVVVQAPLLNCLDLVSDTSMLIFPAPDKITNLLIAAEAYQSDRSIVQWLLSQRATIRCRLEADLLDYVGLQRLTIALRDNHQLTSDDAAQQVLIALRKRITLPTLHQLDSIGIKSSTGTRGYTKQQIKQMWADIDRRQLQYQ